MKAFRDNACLQNVACLGRVVLGFSALTAVLSCSNQPPPILVPKIDPAAAAREAVAHFDRNGNGALESEEIIRCPGLVDAKDRIDTDGDGKLTLEELTKRFGQYVAEGIGVISFVGTVYFNNQPVEGARVTLEPEEFWHGGLRAAEGVTDSAGHFRVKTLGLDVDGAQPGIYRIRVSKTAVDGKEIIPTYYNTESHLGAEIAVDSKVALEGLEIRIAQRRAP
ncbi:MAG: hypothetical protein NZ899_15015 [Thermoguttaceae bacterium]|nr:hypothetical protein [Thermoguttaceae bacterium]MDW8080233.1 hypothetical protein [Thermoguttaceae bacterium]